MSHEACAIDSMTSYSVNITYVTKDSAQMIVALYDSTNAFGHDNIALKHSKKNYLTLRNAYRKGINRFLSIVGV